MPMETTFRAGAIRNTQDYRARARLVASQIIRKNTAERAYSVSSKTQRFTPYLSDLLAAPAEAPSHASRFFGAARVGRQRMVGALMNHDLARNAKLSRLRTRIQ